MKEIENNFFNQWQNMCVATSFKCVNGTAKSRRRLTKLKWNYTQRKMENQ